MKVGLAQVNTIVGDLAGNRELILEAYKKLVEEGAELVVFPEMVLCGYPPRDLLFKRQFVPDTLESLNRVAASIGDVPAVIGFADANNSGEGRRFYNAAAWCRNGQVEKVGRKCLLPAYDVFDEDRYFEPSPAPLVVEYAGRRVGVTICEDIWTGPLVETGRYYSTNPCAQLADIGIDLLVNLSASPWHFGKDSTRMQIVGKAADHVQCPVVYVNAVGGNDELIFDGHSMVMRPNSVFVDGLAGFRCDSKVIEVDAEGSGIAPAFEREGCADIYDALVLGLRDYAGKCGFKRALIGLSGGIDSALVAVLAAEALGPENVMGVSLPSSISSDHSRTDAAGLAANLGLDFQTISIAELVHAAGEALAPLFAGLPADVTEENIQARARGLLLMGISNKFGALLLTTGNKSEIAVGYCTLYGDMAGGLAVLSDLPKTKVFDLSRWINREREIIPWNTIEKPPSAELRPDQMDEDSLPPYPVLDRILQLYIEEGYSSAAIINEGIDEAIVRDIVRKVDLNEYKRKQAAPGLKISPVAFGVGRRIPIVQRYIS